MNRARLGLLIWLMLILLPRCGGETDGDLPLAGASGAGPQDSSQEDSSHEEEVAEANSEEASELKAAQPEFSLPPGIYEGKQTLALSTSTPGASILFTADGSTPGLSSTEYVVPIQLSEGTTTIKAIAVAAGWLSSDVTAGVFIVKPIQRQQAAAPVFVPPSGAACTTSLDVSLSSATPGTEIHYTTDGSDPGASTPMYASPLAVGGKMTIRALAIDPTGTFLDSPISSASYACLAQAASPTFTPPAGKYSTPQTVTISSATSTATIHYSIDGTVPTVSSPLYSTPITLQSSVTLRAVAMASDYQDSEVATANYEISGLPEAATPTMSPPPGSYPCNIQVTLSSATPSAEIRYTMDQTDPVETSLLYNGPLLLTLPLWIHARAFAPGYSPSSVAKGSYSAGSCSPTAPPTISPSGGGYCNSVVVSITPQEFNGVVTYTLDGSEPTATNGTVYGGPFVLSQTTTVRAVTAAPALCICYSATEVYTVTSCADQ